MNENIAEQAFNLLGEKRSDNYRTYPRPDGCWDCHLAVHGEGLFCPSVCSLDNTLIQPDAICDRYRTLMKGVL